MASFGKSSDGTYYEWVGDEGSIYTLGNKYVTLSNSSFSSSMRSVIPAYTQLSRVDVCLRWKTSVGSSKGDGYLYIGDTNVGGKWKTGKDWRDDWVNNLQGYFQSGTANAGLPTSEIRGRFEASWGRTSYYVFKIRWYPKYTITVNGGSGGGTYNMGSSVTIKASIPAGYNFVKWSDGNTNESRTVTVTGNATYTAEFTPQTCQVILEDGEGLHGAKATLSGGGQYKFGDTVTIKAEAPIHHAFYAWRSFDIPNGTYIWENPFTFTIDESLLYEGKLYDIKISCLLEFTGYTVKAEIQPEKAGKVEWGVFYAEINEGFFSTEGDVTQEGVLIGEDYLDNFWINAVPNKGYEFVEWSDGETANPRQVNLTDDATFTARFSKKQHTISLIRTIINGPSDVSDDCYILGDGTYEYGTEVTLEARVNPSSDYEFVGWQDGEESAIRTIIVTEDYTYRATFRRLKCTVTFKNYDDTVLQTTKIEIGTKPQYTGPTPIKESTVEVEYTFIGWEPSLDYTRDDTTFVAQFTATKRKYTISASVINGTIDGVGTYEYGTSIVLTVTPDNGYKFEKWSDGDTQNPRTITVTGNATYEAQIRQLVLKFKSVKIYYPTEVNVASPDNPLIADEKAQIVVQIALE